MNVEVVLAEGDWVVIHYHLKARGRASGLEVEFVLTSANRVRDGLILEAHHRWDRADALDAAGLSE
jgi:hypothetical protein